MTVYFVAIVQKINDVELQTEYGKAGLQDIGERIARGEASLVTSSFDTNRAGGRLYDLNEGLKAAGIKRFETLEGEPADGITIVSFTDRAAFEAWYYSEEYQELLKMRLRAADCQSFYVEGF